MAEYVPTVSPELIFKVVEKSIAEHEEFGEADGMFSAIAALRDECEPKEIHWVVTRMTALATLVSEGEGGYWSMDVEGESYNLVNEALFRAVAVAPLEIGPTVGETKFDPKTVLELALRESDEEGSA